MIKTRQPDMNDARVARRSSRALIVGLSKDVELGEGLLHSVKKYGPNVEFRPIKSAQNPSELNGLDALIVSGFENLDGNPVLRNRADKINIIVISDNSRVTDIRRIWAAGATDILAPPVTPGALALSLERIILGRLAPNFGGSEGGGVTAFLKAGGGVGASFLLSQIAAKLAKSGSGHICAVDFDIQFGAVGHYLDAAPNFTISDAIANSMAVNEMSLKDTLFRHKSGCYILPAPMEVAPLELVSTSNIEVLDSVFKRSFSHTLVDLPSHWTVWTYKQLQLADRIVIVTRLSVSHMLLVKKQLSLITAQKLDQKPLTLVLNAVTDAEEKLLSIRDAQKSLGKTFDSVIRADFTTANIATNQGLEVDEVKASTKLGDSIADLASVASGIDISEGVRSNNSMNTRFKFW